jgi:hypothetical protein
VTENGEIWCLGKKTFFRAFPPGELLDAPLSNPKLRKPEFAVGTGGQLWYSAEMLSTCPTGPENCTEIGGYVVGEITEPSSPLVGFRRPA